MMDKTLLLFGGKKVGMKKSLLILLIFGLASLVTLTANAAPQDVAKALFPKTVLITVNDPAGRPLSLGSGFVLKKGYIISNFHVVEGAGSGFVRRIGDKTKYKITGVAAKDKVRDLVVLAVEGMNEDGVLLSKRESAEVGETVFAVGNPRGLEGTFSHGIVSSIREIDGFSLLQITAPISPGSSGGPIANEKGEVIGVAVATFKGGQNLNFAIPVQYVLEIEFNISKPVPLSQSVTPAKGKSLLSNLEAGKSTEGLSAGSFLWDGQGDGLTFGSDGDFTLSLKNNLDTAIRDAIVLVIFYDKSEEVIDFTFVKYKGMIPAGMGKRVNGEVDPSTKQLTTSRIEQMMYSDQPNTKLEFRTLGFTLESD